MLGLAEASMTPQPLRLWRRIRIPPAKWGLSPWGDAGDGFWVVAILGQQAVWYNDIEDGFNVSRFDSRGDLGEYRANQDELQRVLQALLDHP